MGICYIVLIVLEGGGGWSEQVDTFYKVPLKKHPLEKSFVRPCLLKASDPSVIRMSRTDLGYPHPHLSSPEVTEGLNLTPIILTSPHMPHTPETRSCARWRRPIWGNAEHLGRYRTNRGYPTNDTTLSFSSLPYRHLPQDANLQRDAKLQNILM